MTYVVDRTGTVFKCRSQCDDKRTEESRNGRNHREKRKANPYKLTYSELVEYTEHNLLYGERQ